MNNDLNDLQEQADEAQAAAGEMQAKADARFEAAKMARAEKNLWEADRQYGIGEVQCAEAQRLQAKADELQAKADEAD